MAFKFPCPKCGKRLKATEEMVGRRAQCPDCKAIMEVPAPVYDVEAVPEPLPPVETGYSLQPEAPAPVAEERRQPCPKCGEMILERAVKCRYCGEIFDETLKRREKRRRHDPEDNDLSGGEIALAVLCSGIACIVGIVWMIQGKPKGIKLVGLSLLFAVLWNILRFAIEAGMR
jgi:predicted RNA-binding Zn-ribbon protein involved in translation (DUF1610 family)